MRAPRIARLLRPARPSMTWAWPPGMTRERLGERKKLLRAFDTLRRDLDSRAELAGMDRFTAQAFEMLTSAKTRTALDISQEPEPVREKYGIRGPNAARAARWLQARRLVEAGVPVVNFRAAGQEDWDTHTGNFSQPAPVAAADSGPGPVGPGERPARPGAGQGRGRGGLGRNGPHAQGHEGSSGRRPRSLA